MAEDGKTWPLIHAERARLVDQLDQLSADQWNAISLCGGWTVHVAAGHILAGAEQTTPNFLARLAANAFRFDAMIERDAQRFARLSSLEIVRRLRERTATTNCPPAPVAAMLGEVVVHGADIRRPLGLPDQTSAEALQTCLRMYERASFPVGGKKRISGLKLQATDVDWRHGDGPEVSGPAVSLLLAMTGRRGGWDDLTGEGLSRLKSRIAA
jgi:uncharacterized protein (TIGR03083 family)